MYLTIKLMSVFVQHLKLRSDAGATNALDIDIDASTVTMVATSAIEMGPRLTLGAVADVEAELGTLARAITDSGAAAVQSKLDAYELSNDAAVTDIQAQLNALQIKVDALTTE